MTDLLFVTEEDTSREDQMLNHNNRYRNMTTLYMNRLTIDLADKTEIVGSISMPNVFHFDFHKCIDWKQASQEYGNKKGSKSFLISNKSSSILLLLGQT